MPRLKPWFNFTFDCGVGHINRVVRVDEDAARPAKLSPLVEERPVLIEDLDAVVPRSPTNSRPCESMAMRMQAVELARARCLSCPTP